MNRNTIISFRGDAILDFTFGILLSFSPWIDPLFTWMQLPNPHPGLFTQFAGVLLVGYAYLLWCSPNHVELARFLGWTVGLVNSAGIIVILGWLTVGGLDTGIVGITILLTACLLLSAFSVYEVRYAIQSQTRDTK